MIASIILLDLPTASSFLSRALLRELVYRCNRCRLLRFLDLRHPPTGSVVILFACIAFVPWTFMYGADFEIT
jgi:hypothetical protein